MNDDGEERSGSQASGGLPVQRQSSGDHTDINSLILSKLDKLNNDIAASRKELAQFTTELKDLKTEFNKFSSNLEKELKLSKKKISKLSSENHKFKEQITVLNREIASCSQTSFQNFVKIDNFPVTVNENLFTIIRSMCEVIGIDLREGMIDFIYRRKFGLRNVPSIIIKFIHISVKNKFIIMAKKNKEKLYPEDPTRKIFVNELLSSYNFKIFMMARDFKKQNLIEAAWHRNGNIFIKNKADNKTIIIRCKEDLLLLKYNTPTNGDSSEGEEEQERYDSDVSTLSNRSKRKRTKTKIHTSGLVSASASGNIKDFLVKKGK